MKLREKLNALKAARAEYHEKANTLTPPQIAAEVEKFVKMQTDIASAITEGAKECPDCGNPPHGIFHDGTPNAFEIGCVHCRDHRVREALPEDAIDAWHAGKYLPAREPGTLVMTHRSSTGEIKSQREVTPVKPA
jgi:hypothetical protein